MESIDIIGIMHTVVILQLLKFKTFSVLQQKKTNVTHTGSSSECNAGVVVCQPAVAWQLVTAVIVRCGDDNRFQEPVCLGALPVLKCA